MTILKKFQFGLGIALGILLFPQVVKQSIPLLIRLVLEIIFDCCNPGTLFSTAISVIL